MPLAAYYMPTRVQCQQQRQYKVNNKDTRTISMNVIIMSLLLTLNMLKLSTLSKNFPY